MPMVTVEEFIESLDPDEAAELSHLNKSGDMDIYKRKIEVALIDAEAAVLSYLLCVPSPLPSAIQGAVKRWIKKIARYDLDYLNRREPVEAEWDKFTEWAFAICPPKKDTGSDDSGGGIGTVETVMSAFSI